MNLIPVNVNPKSKLLKFPNPPIKNSKNHIPTGLKPMHTFGSVKYNILLDIIETNKRGLIGKLNKISNYLTGMLVRCRCAWTSSQSSVSI